MLQPRSWSEQLRARRHNRFIRTSRKPRFATLASIPLVFYFVIGGTGLAGAAAATLAVRATDGAGFCGNCHQMRPFYQAWQVGPHKRTPCVACHVDRGASPLTDSQFYYAVHGRYTGRPRSQAATAMQVSWNPGRAADREVAGVKVPDSRCRACHRRLSPSRKSVWAHLPGDRKHTCVDCHGAIGHEASRFVLARAGLAGTGAEPRELRRPAASGPPGHKETLCFQCHNSSSAGTACAVCHEAKHASRGPCDLCHKPGKAFKFSHPSRQTCAECHALPDRHAAVPASADCAACHRKTGAKWLFVHPSTSNCAQCHRAPDGHFDGRCSACHSTSTAFSATRLSHTGRTACLDCHRLPSGHRATTAQCSSCHEPGDSWIFRHPSSSECRSCHEPPARHFGSNCASCHSPDVPFASTRIDHTGRSRCVSCHRRPRSHPSTRVVCSRCHQAGVAWSVRHTSSPNCASCHKPTSHGSRPWCNYCHRRGVAFSAARFTHPTLSNHTWKTFACRRCHLSSYSSASCTACHGPGGSDD